MKIYREEHPADPRALKFFPPGSLTLDIETTGLRKETDMIILIGCTYPEKDRLHLIQWFNDDAVSEEEMLREFLAFLQGRSGPLITFNGERFDIPFLKAHLNYNDMSDSPYSHPLIDSFTSLDLYREIHCFSHLFSMERSTQKDWEIHMGICREDRISGAQVITCYKEYLKTKDQELGSLILLHNRDDILHLASLPALLSYRQLTDNELVPESMEESMENEQISLSFRLGLPEEIIQPLVVETGSGKIEAGPETGKLILTIPIQQGRMYHYYPDYRNYFYLPAEDRAIHKSVGVYVDRAHREKARPETAYVSSESIFLPLPLERSSHGFNTEVILSLPKYKKAYDDIREYLNLDDLLRETGFSEDWKTYLNAMIHEILLQKIKSEKKKKQTRKKRK